MNFLRWLLMSLGVVVLLSSIGCGQRDTKPRFVDIDQVLAAPLRYSRQWIIVRGYMSNKLEDVFITADKNRIDGSYFALINTPVIVLVHPRYAGRYVDILTDAEISTLRRDETKGVHMAIGPRYADDDHAHGRKVEVTGFFVVSGSASVVGSFENVLMPVSISMLPDGDVKAYGQTNDPP